MTHTSLYSKRMAVFLLRMDNILVSFQIDEDNNTTYLSSSEKKYRYWFGLPQVSNCSSNSLGSIDLLEVICRVTIVIAWEKWKERRKWDETQLTFLFSEQVEFRNVIWGKIQWFLLTNEINCTFSNEKFHIRIWVFPQIPGIACKSQNNSLLPVISSLVTSQSSMPLWKSLSACKHIPTEY